MKPRDSYLKLRSLIYKYNVGNVEMLSLKTQEETVYSRETKSGDQNLTNIPKYIRTVARTQIYIYIYIYNIFLTVHYVKKLD